MRIGHYHMCPSSHELLPHDDDFRDEEAASDPVAVGLLRKPRDHEHRRPTKKGNYPCGEPRTLAQPHQLTLHLPARLLIFLLDPVEGGRELRLFIVVSLPHVATQLPTCKASAEVIAASSEDTAYAEDSREDAQEGAAHVEDEAGIRAQRVLCDEGDVLADARTNKWRGLRIASVAWHPPPANANRRGVCQIV